MLLPKRSGRSIDLSAAFKMTGYLVFPDYRDDE